MSRKTIKQKTLELIKNKPGLNAIKLGKELGLPPHHRCKMKLMELEKENLIKWNSELNGWVAVNDQEKGERVTR